MRLLLDVDGVVANMVLALLNAIGSKSTPSDFPTWDVLKALPKEEHDRAIEVLEDPSFWLNLPLVEGAKRGVQELRDQGYEVVWVTAPWKSCPGWDEARRSWIRKHFGPDDEIIITADKQTVDGDLFIDDKPDNVESWKKAHPGKPAFLFNTPHNKDSDLRRCSW
jgi:5'(3')-deoxyribonucleotidase